MNTFNRFTSIFFYNKIYNSFFCDFIFIIHNIGYKYYYITFKSVLYYFNADFDKLNILKDLNNKFDVYM